MTSCNNTDQLVDISGTAAPVKVFRSLVTSKNFFVGPDNDDDRQEQLQNRRKILARVDFPAFNPATEIEFEEWVEKAERLSSRERLCVQVFHDAWTNCAVGTFRDIVEMELASTHLELVDNVARAVFRNQRSFAERLLRELICVGRKESVLDAMLWLKRHCLRLARVARRAQFPIILFDGHLLEIARRIVPEYVVREIELLTDEPAWDEFWSRAANVERSFQSRRAVPQALGPGRDVYPAEQRAMEDGEIRGAQPKGECKGCGKTGHFYKNCPMRKHRCYTCNQIGHISPACRNYSKKDASGRVQTLVETKPSKTVLIESKDRTTEDKVLTVGNFMEFLKGKAVEKRTANAARRERKKQEKGVVTRPPVYHEVAVAEEVDVDSDVSDHEETDDILTALKTVCDLA